MISLAELKRRLTVGVSLRLIYSKYNHKYAGTTRKIIAKHGKGITLEGGSNLTWGVSAEYLFYEQHRNQFSVLERMDGDVLLTYEVDGAMILSDLKSAWLEIARCYRVPRENRTQVEKRVTGFGICGAACSLCNHGMIDSADKDAIYGVLDAAMQEKGSDWAGWLWDMMNPENDRKRAEFCEQQAAALETNSEQARKV